MQHQTMVISAENKQEFYTQLQTHVEALILGENDGLANTANVSALLYEVLPEVNWVGFYFMRSGELVVGPFQGKPACARIPLGRGVCGTAALKRETIVVPDVHAFPGHIACDSASNSEIVVPLIKEGKLLGVLDIDSPVGNRFDDDDRTGMEKIASLVVECSRFDFLL